MAADNNDPNSRMAAPAAIRSTVWLCPWCFWTDDGCTRSGGRMLAMEQDRALVLHEKLNGEYGETRWMPWSAIELVGHSDQAQRPARTTHE